MLKQIYSRQITIVSLEFTSIKYRKEKQTSKLRDDNAG